MRWRQCFHWAHICTPYPKLIGLPSPLFVQDILPDAHWHAYPAEGHLRWLKPIETNCCELVKHQIDATSPYWTKRMKHAANIESRRQRPVNLGKDVSGATQRHYRPHCSQSLGATVVLHLAVGAHRCLDKVGSPRGRLPSTMGAWERRPNTI
jgi:hypothetical protein